MFKRSSDNSLSANNFDNIVELKAKLAAIDKSQAVIEFHPDGTIITANQNFQEGLEYSLEEIQGQHHQIFVDKEYAKSEEYKSFWSKLANGEFYSGQFKRFTKSGEEIWIQATYNPIFNEKHEVVKVVKFASDITQEKFEHADLKGKVDAISRSQAVIEFKPDGTILDANDNFLNTVGYSLDEIQGQHHSMFANTEYAESHEYKQFWVQLREGNFDSGQYKRFGKGGKEVWIQASYNPIFDPSGKVVKVVKFASDITAEKFKNADFEGQIEAMDKSQAVIEFELDGTIKTANKNFTDTLGYSLDEIVGNHHSMFADPEYAKSNEYKSFWEKLGRGEFDSGQYKRFGKGGKEIWIQASYNPIFTPDGVPYKVVKFATDLTTEKKAYYNLVDQFENASNQLATASEELKATAQEMSGNAEKTFNESSSASRTSEEVSQGVISVATSTDQMTASIKEISKTSRDASDMSRSALEQAETANSTIAELGEASEEIGNVVKVISSIAQQTNLLALNATIEAARAGESGKGFSVVANEVKELAKQTALATEEITKKIGNVQVSTDEAVNAITSVNSAILRLNELAGQTATAVEEQSATTSEVSRVLQSSREGVENISATITNVESAATNSAAAATQTLDAADELSKMAASLGKLIDDVKAA